MQTRCGISLKQKGYTYWAQTYICYIHGITCDNQRYPWYIPKHWYIPGISLLYAKTRKLINRVKIPDVINSVRGFWCDYCLQSLQGTLKHPTIQITRLKFRLPVKWVLNSMDQMDHWNFWFIENSLMHKSRAGHGEGAMVRVDRKCEAYVWVRGRWCGVEEAGERGGEGDGSQRLGVSIYMKWRQVVVIH